MKGLPGLIQLNQCKVDEQRRKVTALEILYERLSEEVSQLQADIEREGRNSGDSVGSSQAFSAFLAGAMAQREKLRGSIADLQLQISAAKDDIADAYRKLKSYEVSQASRDAREHRKQELRERVKMDEIGKGMHRRKTGAV
jgi:flagellar FliJ protein